MTDSSVENALLEALRVSAKVYQQRERAAMSMSVSDSSVFGGDKVSHHSDGAYVEKWEQRKKRRAEEAAAAKAAEYPNPRHEPRNVTISSLLSREEAIAKGLTRYFTGEKCSHGHLAERIVSTRTCVICHREHQLSNRTHRAREARRQAKAEGKERYFTGVKCPRGHVSERVVSTGRCVACQNEDAAKSRRRKSEASQ